MVRIVGMNVPLPAEASRTSPSVLLTRRRLLRSALALGVGGGAVTLLAGCTIDNVPEIAIPGMETQQPNAELLALWAHKSVVIETLRAQVQAGDGSSSEWLAMHEHHALLIEQEFFRLCGTNRQGQVPEHCQEAWDNNKLDVSTRFAAGEFSGSVLEQHLNSASDQFIAALSVPEVPPGVLTPLFAAHVTHEAVPRVLQVQQTFDAATDAIATHIDGTATMQLLELVYPAIYASGIALAADKGANRLLLMAVAARLRQLRDHLLEIAAQWQSQGTSAANLTPAEPQSSYILPSEYANPVDSVGAAALMNAVLQPITTQLVFLAATSEHGETRRWASEWAGLSARGQAATDRIAGINPATIHQRGV